MFVFVNESKTHKCFYVNLSNVLYVEDLRQYQRCLNDDLGGKIFFKDGSFLWMTEESMTNLEGEFIDAMVERALRK